MGEGELSLEKLRGEVSLLYGLLEGARGEVSLRDLLERRERENSSVGEKEGMKALGSLGVEVRDLQEL